MPLENSNHPTGNKGLKHVPYLSHKSHPVLSTPPTSSIRKAPCTFRRDHRGPGHTPGAGLPRPTLSTPFTVFLVSVPAEQATSYVALPSSKRNAQMLPIHAVDTVGAFCSRSRQSCRSAGVPLKPNTRNRVIRPASGTIAGTAARRGGGGNLRVIGTNFFFFFWKRAAWDLDRGQRGTQK